MSVSVEKLAGLRRRLSVSVPAQKVVGAYNKRLQQMAKTAKLSGFRPGKVPTNVIEKRYGQGILQEVAQELIQTSLQNAIKEQAFRVAGIRHVDEPKELNKDQDLQYSADVEIFPEITLQDLSGEKVEKLKVDIGEAEIDRMVGKLQMQHAHWKEVERAAKEGDRVVIDFEGFVDNKPFDRGAAKDFELELGSKQMIPGFEDGIVGAAPNEQREVNVAFPDNYPMPDLAGKEALFKITVHKVKEAELPEITDDFCVKINIEGGIAQMRDDIKANLEREVKRMLAHRAKFHVLEALVSKNPTEIPESFIEAEIEHLQKAAYERMNDADKERFKKTGLPREAYLKQAERRVLLGLLLAEVIKQHEIKVDPSRVREQIEEIAAAYQNPDQVISWYYHDKERLAEIESVVLEDQAVDRLMETMQVEEKNISYDDALNLPPIESE